MAGRHAVFRTPACVWFVLAATLAVASCAVVERLPTELDERDGPISPRGPSSDEYIVIFKSEVSDVSGAARELLRSQGDETALRRLYQNAVKGFTAMLSAQAAEALARNPNVAYVEKDTVRSLMTAVQADLTMQTDAPWGLDRIDQRDLPLDGSYSYSGSGSGVTVFIIDSGIRYSHEEFAGRAGFAFDVFGGNGSDCNGHGTHVAAIVGGRTYGVAKSVMLRSVRVIDCNGGGTVAQGIAGIDWVTAEKKANPGLPMVANMSLGGRLVQAEIDAVQGAVAAGITFVVAASNASVDACSYSPAAAPDAITVGATTGADARRSTSNWGSCVDIFAPGTDIPSAWITSDTATRTMSGTSMAAPHVAGVAALYLQNNPGASPAAAVGALISASTIGRISNAGTGSPDRLLFSAP